MQDAWRIYDDLIGGIPRSVTVTAAGVGLRWCRVASSDGGFGMALTMDERARPALYDEPTFVGSRLRDIAELARSWNFAEAGIGMAAINAWYAHPERVADNGFAPSEPTPWGRVFHPFADAVAGKIVSIVGHFPFAPEPLAQAAELRVLERNTHPGDYPDPAAEYLLGDSDFVFITGSAFINKTMPRLLELAREATTVIVGPSTPLSPVLYEHGADVVTGFVSTAPAGHFDALGGLSLSGMFDHGHRVEGRAA